MSAGWSRVRIFNPSGLLLDEIDVPTKRSWVLNSQTSTPGRCDFTIPIYSSEGGLNPKATYANFKYGNLILIEHKPSVNADGTQNGLLPPWCGMMLTPQSWNYGKLSITAYSIEQLLLYRPVGIAFIHGVPGGVVQQCLRFGNNWPVLRGGGITVQPGSIDMSGPAYNYNATASCYEEIQHMARLASFDWDVTPQLTANNRLQLFLNWYRRKGIDANLVLSNLNLQNTSPLYTEQGLFYNTILGYADATTSGTRVYAISQNLDSVALHGVLAAPPVIFSGTIGAAQDVIQTMTDAYLAQHALPTRTFAPTILDEDNSFSYCSIGNSLLIQVDTVGFQNGGIGLSGRIRITAMEYDDMINTCKVAGVLQ